MLYSIKLYIDFTISKSSALSMSVLLIFEMPLMNSGLFLKANFLSYAWLFGSLTLDVRLTITYRSF